MSSARKRRRVPAVIRARLRVVLPRRYRRRSRRLGRTLVVVGPRRIGLHRGSVWGRRTTVIVRARLTMVARRRGSRTRCGRMPVLVGSGRSVVVVVPIRLRAVPVVRSGPAIARPVPVVIKIPMTRGRALVGRPRMRMIVAGTRRQVPASDLTDVEEAPDEIRVVGIEDVGVLQVWRRARLGVLVED